MATVGGVIPNSTTLLGLDANDPVLSVANAAAAKSWFVPNTPKESELESQNVYTSMLAEIMSGQQSVAAGDGGGRPASRHHPERLI